MSNQTPYHIPSLHPVIKISFSDKQTLPSNSPANRLVASGCCTDTRLKRWTVMSEITAAIVWETALRESCVNVRGSHISAGIVGWPSVRETVVVNL